MDDLKFQTPNYTNPNPVSRIGICKGVPLDNSYTNTLTFTNVAAQLQYFESKVVLNSTALSPIGLNTFVRVPCPADQLYDCNYCIISNGNYSPRNLFCFITSVDYVNPNVCKLNFEVDIMQTWYFSLNIQPCLVEREHVNDDAIGKNTIEEGLPLGQYRRKARIKAGVSAKSAIMVTVAGDVNQADYNDLTAGIFSGLREYYFEITNGSAPPIQDLLQRYVNDGKEDQIISIQMIPATFYTPRGTAQPVTKEVSVSKQVNDLDGYTPKNNKLRAFPYSYLEVDNTQGEVTIYKFEYFSSADCTFKLVGSTSGDSATVLMYPLNYDSIGNNIMEHTIISGFPLCAWSGDAYKAYLAHNSMKNTHALASSAISIGSGLLMASNPATAAAGMAATATSTLGFLDTAATISEQDHNAQLEANKMRGTKGSNPIFSAGLMDFWLTVRTVDYSHAKMIDDYFTRFGYRVNCIKKPNITGRKSFNYVKTIGSCITGNIPFNDLARINAIFDKGITFWHGDYVGNFGRDNGIV